MTFDAPQTPEQPEIQNTPSSMHDWSGETEKKIHTGRLIALIALLALLLGYYFFVLIPKGKTVDTRMNEIDTASIEADLSTLEESTN